MIAIVIVNVILIAIGIAVATGLISRAQVSHVLNWVHSIIGITAPAPERARSFALIWIGSMIVIVDGLLTMLVLLTVRLIRL